MCIRDRCREFIDVFSTSVRSRPASVEPMEIVVDRLKWRQPAHRLPPRRHSSEKQAVILTQTEALLKLGVIEESRATEWSQVHLVPKPIACTVGLEVWPIPNILKGLERIGTLKPRLFGLIDFTAGYHQTLTRPIRVHHSGQVISMDTRGHGTERSWPLLTYLLTSKVLAGLIYRIASSTSMMCSSMQPPSLTSSSIYVRCFSACANTTWQPTPRKRN